MQQKQISPKRWKTQPSEASEIMKVERTGFKKTKQTNQKNLGIELSLANAGRAICHWVISQFAIQSFI